MDPTPRILVVDDDDLGRKLTSQRLLKVGYRVGTAGGGDAALQAANEHEYDLVLLDMHMPGMDGMDVLRALRASRGPLELPVIMLTAEDDATAIAAALNAGANDYIIKPLNLAVADARIRAQLSFKRYAALKDELLRFASHDIKKPVMLLQDISAAMSDELQRAQPNLEQLRDDIGLLQAGARQMEQVISGFLDNQSMAGDETHHDTAIGTVIEDVVAANQRYAASKGVTLHAQVAPEARFIMSDGFRARQVIDNLVGNALKFSPSGARANVSARIQDAQVIVAVDDTGPGLRDEDMTKLFVRGAKLSNAPTGNESSSGIGLALCKELVEQMGGRIDAHNNADGGACFWFALPAEATARAASV